MRHRTGALGTAAFWARCLHSEDCAAGVVLLNRPSTQFCKQNTEARGQAGFPGFQPYAYGGAHSVPNISASFHTDNFLARLDRVRQVGRDRWMALCPAHPERTPSLSIREKDGRILLYCFTRCNAEAIVSALGLSMRDLFSGPPPTADEARQVARERLKRETRARAQRRERGALADRYRKLTAVVESLAARLACLPDGDPDENALTNLYHLALERLRAAEAELEVRQ